jgi:hypothetical protein
MGVVSKEDLVAQADQRVIELEKPGPWLIELSSEGDSSELEHLIEAADDQVYLETLRLAYHAWREGKISESTFVSCCRTLWKQAGCHSRWYSDLISVDADFDLMQQGVTREQDASARIRYRVEEILQR